MEVVVSQLTLIIVENNNRVIIPKTRINFLLLLTKVYKMAKKIFKRLKLRIAVKSQSTKFYAKYYSNRMIVFNAV